MVAIFKYENGLKFTGFVVENEKSAWKFLDDKFGITINGTKLPCNHDAFKLVATEKI